MNKHYPEQYMVDFTATFKSTAITFAFRDDPADISFNEASVTDLTTPSDNLLTNCDFTGAVYTDNGNPFTPVSWTLCQSIYLLVMCRAVTCHPLGIKLTIRGRPKDSYS